MLLFHGSEDPELRVIEEGGVFDGMFFSAGRSAASSHGQHVYVVEVEEGEIARSYDLQYDLTPQEVALVDDILVEEYGETSNELWELTAGGDASAFEEEILPEEWDDFAWNAQRVRGRIARELGWRGVEMPDEHGTSYLMFPGVKLRRARRGER